MNKVEMLLRDDGPCLSSDLNKKLVERFCMSSDAARKQVSRGCPDMHRLSGIKFARNARFVYLKKDYRSPFYWKALYRAFQETNSAYWFAISALIQRGGPIPYRHFQICCGSPLKQQKHLSPDEVLTRLESIGVVTRKNIDGLGPCVVLLEHEDQDWLATEQQARLLAENILIRAISNWAKNIGMVSYYKLRDRNCEDIPKVSTVAWDIAGPSFISGLTEFRKGSNSDINPGFFTCDVFLGGKVELRGIEPFIRKCKALKSLKRVGRTLHFFVADEFTSDAFKVAKEAGIMPATVENLFGKEIARGLKVLIKTLDDAAKTVTVEPEKFNILFDSLGKIEGAAGNLRGALFEYFTATLIPKIHPSTRIRINEKCKVGNSSAEADVISEGNGEILFIECKGHQPGGVVDHEEVKKWLQQRVPTLNKYAKQHNDWKSKKLRFEIWTTGRYSDESVALLTEARNSLSKYEIDFLDAIRVKAEVEKCDDKELRNTYFRCFYDHPLRKIEA
ncbi:hypothetical protein BTR40_21810 [Vibrio parahaemolyticus]|uniref:hypothetical protein n=1 Tax=Vibrio parahaemolyticus TaxID=670 RepID=UPI000A3BC901|nr:hypothetical protein [Vibrio parahaemolyticus]OUJ34163.1 hypothetical protein BTR40_21810 [Vibrio parahaemolyticus]